MGLLARLPMWARGSAGPRAGVSVGLGDVLSVVVVVVVMMVLAVCASPGSVEIPA